MNILKLFSIIWILTAISLSFIPIDRNVHTMASEDDVDLPQTQSQSHNTEDQIFSQNADEGRDVWGRLVAKHKLFQNYGKWIFDLWIEYGNKFSMNFDSPHFQIS